MTLVFVKFPTNGGFSTAGTGVEASKPGIGRKFAVGVTPADLGMEPGIPDDGEHAVTFDDLGGSRTG